MVWHLAITLAFSHRGVLYSQCTYAFINISQKQRRQEKGARYKENGNTLKLSGKSQKSQRRQFNEQSPEVDVALRPVTLTSSFLKYFSVFSMPFSCQKGGWILLQGQFWVLNGCSIHGIVWIKFDTASKVLKEVRKIDWEWGHYNLTTVLTRFIHC